MLGWERREGGGDAVMVVRSIFVFLGKGKGKGKGKGNEMVVALSSP